MKIFRLLSVGIILVLILLLSGSATANSEVAQLISATQPLMLNAPESPGTLITWFTHDVDTTSSRGRYNDIAIDSNGYPHISYIDESTSNLMYAYQDSGGWHRYIMDGQDPVETIGWGTALVLDAEDDPHILYFGSMDGTFYAAEAKTGWVIWRFRLGKGTISTPVIIDNFVYIGSIDGNLYCIDTRTNKEVWRFETSHQITGSAIIHRDSVYFGGVDGNIYCLDFRNGRIRWQYATEEPITATPIIHDDILYIGSTDYKMYALPI